MDTTPQEPQMPAGMVEVTREKFFELLYADKRDIMPCISHSPYYTTWETKSREVWGWDSTGWKNPRARQVYAVKAAVISPSSNT